MWNQQGVYTAAKVRMVGAPPSQEQIKEMSVALDRAWALTDSILGERVTSSDGMNLPISVRQPFVFYLGHLPAFAWDLVVSQLGLGSPMDDVWDKLFARGINPRLPSLSSSSPAPTIWPKWSDLEVYRDRVRAAMRLLARRGELPMHATRLIMEHELMHYETLCYMLSQASAESTVRTVVPSSNAAIAASPAQNWIRVPGGLVTLGAGVCDSTVRKDEFDSFRWDNEYGSQVNVVAPFLVARLPVTVAEFCEFIDAGGYDMECFWTADDWKWLCAEARGYPRQWRPCRCTEEGKHVSQGTARWHVLTVSGPVEATEAASWPASVSAAEASAFARWAQARLPSEAEWVLAAHGQSEKCAPRQLQGNLGHRDSHARSVHAGRMSWCGAQDMVGNGWEITESEFKPYPEFRPLDLYPDYSTESFDGDHVVLRGASWATDELLVRPTFRNFYRRRYSFVFSKFRLARPVPTTMEDGAVQKNDRELIDSMKIRQG